MKLEFGGGKKPRGDGWVNVDQCQEADVIHNLNLRPWPFADDSAEEIYSSHCLEHLIQPVEVLREVARIGKLGAKVEIRVPAPYSDLAMVVGHLHVFAPMAAENIDKHFVADFWNGPKRLKLDRYHYSSCERLAKAKMVLPYLDNLDDQLIMEFVPGTAHEVTYFYHVIENECYKP